MTRRKQDFPQKAASNQDRKAELHQNHKKNSYTYNDVERTDKILNNEKLISVLVNNDSRLSNFTHLNSKHSKSSRPPTTLDFKECGPAEVKQNIDTSSQSPPFYKIRENEKNNPNFGYNNAPFLNGLLDQKVSTPSPNPLNPDSYSSSSSDELNGHDNIARRTKSRPFNYDHFIHSDPAKSSKRNRAPKDNFKLYQELLMLNHLKRKCDKNMADYDHAAPIYIPPLPFKDTILPLRRTNYTADQSSHVSFPTFSTPKPSVIITSIENSINPNPKDTVIVKDKNANISGRSPDNRNEKHNVRKRKPDQERSRFYGIKDNISMVGDDIDSSASLNQPISASPHVNNWPPFSYDFNFMNKMFSHPNVSPSSSALPENFKKIINYNIYDNPFVQYFPQFLNSTTTSANLINEPYVPSPKYSNNSARKRDSGRKFSKCSLSRRTQDENDHQIDFTQSDSFPFQNSLQNHMFDAYNYHNQFPIFPLPSSFKDNHYHNNSAAKHNKQPDFLADNLPFPNYEDYFCMLNSLDWKSRYDSYQYMFSKSPMLYPHPSFPYMSNFQLPPFHPLSNDPIDQYTFKSKQSTNKFNEDYQSKYMDICRKTNLSRQKNSPSLGDEIVTRVSSKKSDECKLFVASETTSQPNKNKIGPKRTNGAHHSTNSNKMVRGQNTWLSKGSKKAKDIMKCIWCGDSFGSLPDLTSHMVATQHYRKIIPIISSNALAITSTNGEFCNKLLNKNLKFEAAIKGNDTETSPREMGGNIYDPLFRMSPLVFRRSDEASLFDASSLKQLSNVESTKAQTIFKIKKTPLKKKN
ncbi:unnamed protein product [Gordionus sp. m RMFG-2023]|uniref:uncharacterized protein LOC135927857 isoform X2 n=1 Tax=Gordionus sp. m RMFG-2023 TaxID=3053472 RepID=UPI0030E3E50D